MGLEALIVALLIGAVAGWLAGVVVKGGGFGLVGDIVVGIIGAPGRRLVISDSRAEPRRWLDRGNPFVRDWRNLCAGDHQAH